MFILTIALLAASVLAPSLVEAKKITISSPTASRPRSPLTASSNVLTLNRKKSSQGYNLRSAATLLGFATIANGSSSPILSLEVGEEYATEITFGTQTFEAIVDTGSSDTWLVETGYSCVNYTTNAPLPESGCGFGPTYTPGSTFSEISGEYFSIEYGDLEFATGILGTEEVTLAGIKVKTTVAVVNSAGWNGDGVTSGLIGLAYPAM